MLERNIDTVKRGALLNVSPGFSRIRVSNVKGEFINVFTPRRWSDRAPLGHGRREEALKRREKSEQRDAGADPAILMHMLHRNIDQLFSL